MLLPAFSVKVQDTHTQKSFLKNVTGGEKEQKILKDLTKSKDNKNTMIRPEESCYDFL